MASQPPSATRGAHPLVVRPGRLLAVAPVDEHQAGGDVPASGDGGRVTDDSDREILRGRLSPWLSPEWKGVHPAGLAVDERVVVVLPARLVLLGAVMMVDAEDNSGCCARLSARAIPETRYRVDRPQ